MKSLSAKLGSYQFDHYGHPDSCKWCGEHQRLNVDGFCRPECAEYYWTAEA